MRALVIYESMFGNTQAVATAIAAGLADNGSVEIHEVGQAPPVVPVTVDLVVIGGPTHAFGMSRNTTRRDASNKTDASLVSQGHGIREWIDGLAENVALFAATFDTKVAKPNLPGSAGASAAKRLRKATRASLVGHETFWVSGMTGPLGEGELERARVWGVALGLQVAKAKA